MGYSKDYKSSRNDKNYDRYGSRRSNSSGSADDWLKPSDSGYDLGSDHDEKYDSGESHENSYDSGDSYDSRYENLSHNQPSSASTSERNDYDFNKDSRYKQFFMTPTYTSPTKLSVGRIILIMIVVLLAINSDDDSTTDSRKTTQKVAHISKEAALVKKYDDKNLLKKLSIKPELKADTEMFNQAKAQTFLIHSVEDSKQKSAEFLLGLPVNINITNAKSVTLLQLAMDNKLDNVVKIILARFPDLRAKKKSGVTVIHTAASNNYVDVLTAALDQGVDPSPSAHGMTPLHFAARNGHMNIVQILLEKGANPSMANKYGWYPADVCKDKYPEISQIITKHGGKMRSSRRNY